MKLATAIALGACLFASPAIADNFTAPQSVYQNSVVHSPPLVVGPSQPVYVGQYPTAQYSYPSAQQYNTGAGYSEASPNVFQRWMEMERRKNEWIRQRVFGR